MTHTARPLRRILGLGFGLAIAFGSTIGVGILRLPGMVAEHIGDRTLIIGFWTLGGLYALLGAMAVAELAAMLPQTGGFRVYARRAYGDGAGFAIGWCDWLQNVSSLAYVSITAITFLGTLWPPAAQYTRSFAIATVAIFTGIHWLGLRIGSTMTSLISASIAFLMMALVACCFLIAPDVGPSAQPLAGTVASLPLFSMAMIFALVPALRAILAAYDGWYAPIYMAEENTNPVRTLPRAIIGGALLVTALYLLINVAFLRVLPLPVLAHSELPATEAARILFPGWGAVLVTVISIVTMLSLANNILLAAPRILFAIGRDGLFTEKAAEVSSGGTPRVALAITSLIVVVVMVSGTFEQVVALYAVLFLLCYISTFLAVFVLRWREPDLARPFRAYGHPFSTAIVLLGSVAFLIAAAIEDVRSACIAAVLVAACVPVYRVLERRRRMRVKP